MLALPDDASAPGPFPVVGFVAFTDSPVGVDVSDTVSAEDWSKWFQASYDMPDVQVCTACPVRVHVAVVVRRSQACPRVSCMAAIVRMHSVMHKHRVLLLWQRGAHSRVAVVDGATRATVSWGTAHYLVSMFHRVARVAADVRCLPARC